MTEPRIVLGGMGPKLSGLTWETNRLLRIGRQNNLDVVLRDSSVERAHAEIRHQGMRWILRDLAQNPSYPTLVNKTSLCGKEEVLNAGDIVQIGKLRLRVADIVVPAEPVIVPATRPTPVNGATGNQQIKTSGVHMLIKAKTHPTWDNAP